MAGIVRSSRRSTRRARVLAALPPSLRGAALMPAAALLVHQLRYELAFGADAPRALAAQGHAYLSSLTPWIVLLAALALGASLGGLAQRWAGGDGADPLSRRAAGLRAWLLATLALFAIYAGQELLEGLFASGHLSGLAAVLGDGGWWALPAALLVGGALALALRAEATASAVLAEARPLRLRLRDGAREMRLAPLPLAPALTVPAPLAGAAAGRAPPRSALDALHV